MMMMMTTMFWVLVPWRLVRRCQRFGENTISIFKAKAAMLGSGGIPFCLEEENAEGVGQSKTNIATSVLKK
jgi:hypothetical protein